LKCTLKPSSTVTSLRREKYGAASSDTHRGISAVVPTLTLNASLYIVENQLVERATQSTWSIRQIQICVSACNFGGVCTRSQGS